MLPLAIQGSGVQHPRAGGDAPHGCHRTGPAAAGLKSGSTTLTLDKNAGKATMQRKLLFWARKPLERPLSDFVQVTIDANVDRAAGVELCSTTLVMRDGSAWALPPTVGRTRPRAPWPSECFSASPELEQDTNRTRGSIKARKAAPSQLRAHGDFDFSNGSTASSAECLLLGSSCH